ncbi:MAG TPA: redoxin family protein [Gemmataceae bacterium]|nr:redoxin family protein [Gemmataceae bacterium]
MRLLMPMLLAFALVGPACAQDAVKIGAAVGKLKFTDIRGLPRSLDDFGKKKAYVLVFTNTSCPLVKRYLPTLQALDREYRDKGVQFIAVNSVQEDSLVAMATQAVQHDMELPFVKDFDGSCAKVLGIKRTPEAVILDADRKIRYRGRIDDQYRLGGVRKEPTSRDLQAALDAVLAGKEVATPETNVDGCPITFTRERKPRDVNFAEHVAPILQKHCWSCHQPGGSGPFALTTYKQASLRAEMIAEVTREQRMPPWFASHEFGPFVNRRGLSDEERETIADWARIGAPQGDAKKSPAPPKEPASKWRIGEPDIVLNTGVFELPAQGDIAYKYTILPHVFTEDTWVQFVQILPDNPRSVHHCNMVFANLIEGFTEKNFITGQVPGGEPMALDDGTAFLIPRGSALGLEMHYVATGKPEKCKISIGLRFPRVDVQNRLRLLRLSDRRFAIPPGASAHRVAVKRTLDCDAIGVGLFSHMHVRGKDMTFKATAPDGKTDTLLVIPNYSFSWQIPYRWESGKQRFAKGTRFDCIAHFDNSPFNPYNPDPLATVRFGLQTHHEMMYGFFFYTDANERLGIRIDPKTGAERKKAAP